MKKLKKGILYIQAHRLFYQLMLPFFLLCMHRVNRATRITHRKFIFVSFSIYYYYFFNLECRFFPLIFGFLSTLIFNKTLILFFFYFLIYITIYFNEKWFKFFYLKKLHETINFYLLWILSFPFLLILFFFSSGRSARKSKFLLKIKMLQLW